MSILNIINLSLPQISVLNYDFQCAGNGEVEQCSLETSLVVTRYVNYTGDMFLVFELLSGKPINIELSKNGEQYERLSINYQLNSTDLIMLKALKNTTGGGPNPIKTSYNMYIYRDYIDQNENNGLPVLLNTVRINFNSL